MQYVLSHDYVVRSLRTLESRTIHEHIIMYLALLKQGAPNLDKSTMNEDIKRWYKVDGNEQMPYYRPFISSRKSFWLNENIAGSFAPSSVRDKTLFYDDDKQLHLPKPEHVRKSLLKDKDDLRLCTWAAAGYLFRNALFETASDAPTIKDLLELFIKYFHLDTLSAKKPALGLERSSRSYAYEAIGSPRSENDTEPGLPSGGESPYFLASLVDDGYGLVFDFKLPDEPIDVFEPINDGVDLSESSSYALTIVDPEYRSLNSVDLEIDVPNVLPVSAPHLFNFDETELSGLEDVEKRILGALQVYGGVILSGSPGTSKTFYAEKIAKLLTDDDFDRVRFTQFHASYQFEDFVQGYIPDPEHSSFKPRDGIFLSLCKDAAEHDDDNYVLVIDELSRGDSCRVFGEALTYIEKSKRGKYFYLPSGDLMTIPSNVYIIATMNPIDRGADEVDVAFGRRFATIDMEPSVSLLDARLKSNGLDDALRGGLLRWFADVNAYCKQHDLAGVGHAYFWNVVDKETLKDAWNYQVIHHLRRSFGLRTAERKGFEEDMNALL